MNKDKISPLAYDTGEKVLALLLAVEREARKAALDEAAVEVRDALMTRRHRLERTGGGRAPACSCGGYDSTDESVPAEAWRAHLIEVAVAAIEEAQE